MKGIFKGKFVEDKTITKQKLSDDITLSSFENDTDLATNRYVDEEIAKISHEIENIDLSDYLPLTGGTINGQLNISKDSIITFGDQDVQIQHDVMTGLKISNSSSDASDINLLALDGKVLYNGREVATKNDINSIDNYVDITSNQTIEGTKTFSNVSYFKSDIFSGNSKTATNDGNLGVALQTTGAIHIQSETTPALYFYHRTNPTPSGTFRTNTAGDLFVIDLPLLPNTDNKQLLGTQSLRWSGVYTNYLFATSDTFISRDLYMGSKKNKTDGIKGAILTNEGLLYLQGSSNINSGIHFYQTGASTANAILANTSSGVLTITGNIIPVANNSYNLGTESTRWSNLYTNLLNTSGKATIGGGIFTTGSIFCGGKTSFYDGMSGIALSTLGALALQGTESSLAQVQFFNHGSTLPDAYLSYNTSKYIASSVGLIPQTNNNLNLGTNNYQWNNIYANNILINGANVATIEDIPDTNNFITLDTPQTITGAKTFNSAIYIRSNLNNNPQIQFFKNDSTSYDAVFGLDAGLNFYTTKNIIPNGTNNSVLLGGINNRWANIYTALLNTSGRATIGGDLLVSDSVYSGATSSVNDGLSGVILSGTGTVYIKGSTTNDSRIRFFRNAVTNLEATLALVDSGFSINTTFVPNSNNFHDLGVPNFQWRNLYLSGEAFINNVKVATVNDIEALKSEINELKLLLANK